MLISYSQTLFLKMQKIRSLAPKTDPKNEILRFKMVKFSKIAKIFTFSSRYLTLKSGFYLIDFFYHFIGFKF